MIHYLEGQVTSLQARLKAEAQTRCYRDTVRVLSAFRGVALITALRLAAEIGDIRRFAHPRQLMAYLGLVPSEYTQYVYHHQSHVSSLRERIGDRGTVIERIGVVLQKAKGFGNLPVNPLVLYADFAADRDVVYPKRGIVTIALCHKADTYRWADESRSEGVLSIDEIDERYERQVWGWRLN